MDARLRREKRGGNMSNLDIEAKVRKISDATAHCSHTFPTGGETCSCRKFITTALREHGDAVFNAAYDQGWRCGLVDASKVIQDRTLAENKLARTIEAWMSGVVQEIRTLAEKGKL